MGSTGSGAMTTSNTVKVTGKLDLPEGIAATDVKVFMQAG